MGNNLDYYLEFLFLLREVNLPNGDTILMSVPWSIKNIDYVLRLVENFEDENKFATQGNVDENVESEDHFDVNEVRLEDGEGQDISTVTHHEVESDNATHDTASDNASSTQALTESTAQSTEPPDAPLILLALECLNHELHYRMLYHVLHYRMLYHGSLLQKFSFLDFKV